MRIPGSSLCLCCAYSPNAAIIWSSSPFRTASLSFATSELSIYYYRQLSYKSFYEPKEIHSGTYVLIIPLPYFHRFLHLALPLRNPCAPGHGAPYGRPFRAFLSLPTSPALLWNASCAPEEFLRA